MKARNSKQSTEASMGQEITIQKLPNGITPLLTKSLPPQELDKHRANVCVVMEMMVRKYDKFGWDQMNAGMRQMIREDWLDALADYPVDEVRAACRQHTVDMPNKVPNEGHIKAQIIKARGRMLAQQPKPVEPYVPREEPTAESKARVAEMVANVTREMSMPKGGEA